MRIPIVGGVAALLFVGTASFFTMRRAARQTLQGPIVLAVLPFDDMSVDRQTFLVDGLTEEMVSRVTQISPEHLRVIARTSAMQYQGTKKSARKIGEELGADYILESSIRHEGGRVRITSQLVRTADQTHLWAESYDREMRDLLPLEAEVTADIGEQIQKKLLPTATIHRPASKPVDPEAHELYLKGRYAFNQRSRESLQQSLGYFQQALARQPDYAAAYAGLADSYNLIGYYGFDPTLGAASQAKVASSKALQLDDSMGAAHAALAYTEFMWQEDWPAAEKEFRRALELDDNYVPAHQWYAEISGRDSGTARCRKTLRWGSALSLALARAYALSGNSREAQELLGQLEADRLKVWGAVLGLPPFTRRWAITRKHFIGSSIRLQEIFRPIGCEWIRHSTDCATISALPPSSAALGPGRSPPRIVYDRLL